MPTEPRMISLGFGKFVRADRIFALEPLLGEARGDGRRTKVWVEGILEPVIASRTEVTILRDMGQDAAADAPLLEEAVDLASRLAAAAEAGRVDLSDLGRRARRLLAATTTNQQLPFQPVDWSSGCTFTAPVLEPGRLNEGPPGITAGGLWSKAAAHRSAAAQERTAT